MSDDDHCPICIETMDTITTLDCGHIFHSKCINPWKSTGSRTCPVCRREMTAAGMEEENKRLRAELAKLVAYSNSRDEQILRMTQETRNVEIENIRLLMQLGNLQFRSQKQEEKKMKHDMLTDTMIASIGILLIVLTMMMKIQ